MIWLAVVPPLLLVALLAACWWGANVVFHPPKMLPHTVWPDQFGLKYETVEFPATDGALLKGWLIPAAVPTDRCILLLHGWGDNKGDLLQRSHLLARSFNLFFIDHRNHGESSGAFSSLGYLESRDVEGALAFLRRARPAWAARLGIYGHSMGGAIAAWTAANRPEVRCAVLEAPFPSFNGVVTRFSTNSYALPYFPFVWLTLKVIQWRLGGDPEPFSPIYHVAKIAPRPVLFIAGSADQLMPVADVRILHERAGEPKDLWVVEGATHGKCAEFAKDTYPDKLRSFFERHLTESERVSA